MSEQPNTHLQYDAPAMLYGQGFGAWKHSFCADAADGDICVPARTIDLKAESEYSFDQLGDAVAATINQDRIRLAQYARHGQGISLTVSEEEFERAVRPRIAQYQSVSLLPFPENQAFQNRADVILEQRVRGLLFENGTRAWKRVTDQADSVYQRIIGKKELAVGAKHYDFFSEVLPLARRIMHEEMGIEGLQGFMRMGGDGVLTLPPKDYRWLQTALDPLSGGLMADPGISHIERYREREKLKVEGMAPVR